MTFAEFRQLVATVPERCDDFDLSDYTDIGEIRGIWLDGERGFIWLSERPGIGTTLGVHRHSLDDEHRGWETGNLSDATLAAEQERRERAELTRLKVKYEGGACMSSIDDHHPILDALRTCAHAEVDTIAIDAGETFVCWCTKCGAIRDNNGDHGAPANVWRVPRGHFADKPDAAVTPKRPEPRRTVHLLWKGRSLCQLSSIYGVPVYFETLSAVERGEGI